jgi:hypothetical protein
VVDLLERRGSEAGPGLPHRRPRTHGQGRGENDDLIWVLLQNVASHNVNVT